MEWAFRGAQTPSANGDQLVRFWTPPCSSNAGISKRPQASPRGRPKHPQASPTIPKDFQHGPSGVVSVWDLLHGPTVCARQCRRPSVGFAGSVDVCPGFGNCGAAKHELLFLQVVATPKSGFWRLVCLAVGSGVHRAHLLGLAGREAHVRPETFHPCSGADK
jgi:hypothetical protein